MNNRRVINYSVDEDLSRAPGVDISNCSNLKFIKKVMADYQESWDEEEKRKFRMREFANITELMSYFDDKSEAEEYFSDYLTYENKCNPDCITLTYTDGKILFIPREPWYYSLAEKNMSCGYLCDVLEKTADRIGV